MRFLTKAATGVLGTLVLIIVPFLQADAGSARSTDRRGDALVQYDITRVEYHNNNRWLRSRVHLVDLRRVGTRVTVLASTRAMRADGAAFLVDATYRRDGTRTQRLRIAQTGHMTRI